MFTTIQKVFEDTLSTTLNKSTILKNLEDNVPYSISVSPISSMSSTITKKCQPEAGDRPDLIQTEPFPSNGHGQHTLRVTAQSRSWSSSHGRHTPRVTALLRSQQSSHTPHTPRVTVGVPDSGLGLTRKQNKNKLNEKHEKHENKSSVTQELDPSVSNVFKVCNKIKKVSARGRGQAGSNTNRACPQHRSRPANSASH